MSKFLIILANNQHICENYSLEADAYFSGKPYALTYYRFMAVYPFTNAFLSLVALILYVRQNVSMRTNNTRLLRNLLINLCCWDLAFQLTMGCNQTMIYFMETGQFVGSSPLTIKLYVVILITSIVLVTCTHISRNLSVVLIAIMRYEAVCRACDRKLFFQSTKLTKKVAFIAIVPLLISIPRFLEFNYNVCLPKLKLFYIDSFMLKDAIYFWLYSGIILGVSQSIIPSLTLLILTGFLINTIVTRQKFRQAKLNKPILTATRSQRLRRSDVLISLLCAVFWFCELPGCLKMIDDMNVHLHEVGWYMNFMPCVDSTFNFVVYILAHYHGIFSHTTRLSESRVAHVSLSMRSENMSLSKKRDTSGQQQ